MIAQMGLPPLLLNGAQPVRGDHGTKAPMVQTEAGVPLLVGGETLLEALGQRGGGGLIVGKGLLIQDNVPVPAAGVGTGAAQAAETGIVVGMTMEHSNSSFG